MRHVSLPLVLAAATPFGCAGPGGGSDVPDDLRDGAVDEATPDGSSDSSVLDSIVGDAPAVDVTTADSNGLDAEAGGVCSGQNPGVFQCGSNLACHGATSYCLQLTTGDACEPIPGACSCGTLDCGCLLANVSTPCDSGSTFTCTLTHDGGLFLLASLSCP
jgi:hypothetical protein